MNKLKSRAITVYLFGDRGPSRRELFWKNCAESLTIRKEKRSEIRAERGKIQYDHIAIGLTMGMYLFALVMHPPECKLAKRTESFSSNEKYITKFDQTD